VFASSSVGVDLDGDDRGLPEQPHIQAYLIGARPLRQPPGRHHHQRLPCPNYSNTTSNFLSGFLPTRNWKFHTNFSNLGPGISHVTMGT
jgi:hypothetical protein